MPPLPLPGVIDGVSMTAKGWRAFDEAAEFVRALGLTCAVDWWAYARSAERPRDIPTNPHQAYGPEWRGFGHWLGTSDAPMQRNGGWRSFAEAEAYVRAAGLKTYREWMAWSKTDARPGDIPANPHIVYKTAGWQGYGAFMGTGNRVGGIRGDWREFGEAVAYARGLKLRSFREWKTWRASSARPVDIPSDPRVAYSAEWRGYRHWLGTADAAVSPRWRPFPEARAYAHTLRLRTREEWKTWYKQGPAPPDIPAAPRGVYVGNGWSGWADWLGQPSRKKRRRDGDDE